VRLIAELQDLYTRIYGSPAAIALYRSAGYSDIPHYGYYADNPDTVSLARKLRADPEDSPG
jgi:ribosomal protein S18 acetylase RimI-like enzyme